MIDVTIKEYYSHSMRHLNVEVNGHANYDEHGKDIVCSAVSMLVQAYAETVPNEHLFVEGHAKIESRWMYTEDNKYSGALTMLKKGLDMVSQAYPENVTITHKH